MKVNASNKDNKTEFKNIRIGEVFKHENKYYMKIKEETVVGFFVDTWPACAVGLEDARLHIFNDITLVEPVDGEFVVN